MLSITFRLCHMKEYFWNCFLFDYNINLLTYEKIKKVTKKQKSIQKIQKFVQKAMYTKALRKCTKV